MDIRTYIASKLNEQQTNAALYTDSSSLIIAWAWSGKTRTLTYKIAYLIFEQKIDPRRILAVTFTNKAANEMKERIKEIATTIQSQPLSNEGEQKKEAIDDFDSLLSWVVEKSQTETAHINVNGRDTFKRIWTFHSNFLKILREDIEKIERWYTTWFTVYDASEAQSVLKDTIKQLNLKDVLERKDVWRKISSLKSTWILPDRYRHILEDEADELVAKVYERYQKTLQTSNCLDFDDLLLLVYTLFKKLPDVLQKWRDYFVYVMVDEAQDTNHIQFEIMRMLTENGWNITFIGDDFQSIYKRRGALMENFLHLDRRRPDIEIFKLEINYRSLPHIVDAWNAIIAWNTKQYKKDITANRTGSDTIKVFEFGNESEEAISIIWLMQKMKEDQKWSRWDFAILYRTNAQSQPFEQILVNEWIPYKIRWWFKFFDRKEIKDVISYCKYFMNPRDNVSLKRIINTPARKIGATSVQKLEDYSIMNNISLTDIVTQIDSLPTWITKAATTNIKQFATMIKFIWSALDESTPAKLIQQIVSTIKYKDYLIHVDGKEKGKERFENIGQLVTMATTSNPDKETWLEALETFLENVSLMTDIEENQDNSTDVVKLMSVHTSKGLEFKAVFVVGLEDSLFPLAKAKFDTDEMEEERRLMYVAVTRAEERLFLSHTQTRFVRWQQKYNVPSRFIDEIPSELLKIYTFGESSTREPARPNVEEWDYVLHKLFGEGEVIEMRWTTALVKFENARFGMRKLDSKFLEVI